MNIKITFASLIATSLFAVCANGATITGYSVNSDSGSENQDSLYRIDLPTGLDEPMGRLIANPEIQRDTEGLAFSPDGELWAVDDLTRTLFRINTLSGEIMFQQEQPLDHNIPAGGGNDFGMTFACDGTLYITSVVTNTLYELDLQGNTTVIGQLGAPISAIAAIGNPTRLYGLGNGLDSDGETDSPNLYSIDLEINKGAATKIGGGLGAGAGAYNQAGLAFDSEGKLWAVTDRRGVDRSIDGLPSQVLSINVETGIATWEADTYEVGFESLAISPPSQCTDLADPNSGPPAIPTLNRYGLLLAVFTLMISGLLLLRTRRF